jgi:glycosyltransferase involved in cell wall biosynthesis
MEPVTAPLVSPLVSVIVPVYNGAGFIIETLESVRRQTHTGLECIIIDDGSTDNTAEVVQKWIAGDSRYTAADSRFNAADSRFSYVYQPNQGLSAARNTGLDRAKGDFIQFLDADDVLLPAKLGEQLTVMAQDGVKVSYTDYSTGTSADIYKPADFYKPAIFRSSESGIPESGSPESGSSASGSSGLLPGGASGLLPELIARWESSLIIPPHSWLFSADLFREKKMRFDTSLPNHEDFDCWVNIFRSGPGVKYIDKKLCVYRITESSMSKKIFLMGEGFLQVLEKQTRVAGQSKELIRVIGKKRRETLRRYNRIDRMTFKDKILLFDHILYYYGRRVLVKLRLKT